MCSRGGRTRVACHCRSWNQRIGCSCRPETTWPTNDVSASLYTALCTVQICCVTVLAALQQQCGASQHSKGVELNSLKSLLDHAAFRADDFSCLAQASNVESCMVQKLRWVESLLHKQIAELAHLHQQTVQTQQRILLAMFGE